jgi:hypothetical protein
MLYQLSYTPKSQSAGSLAAAPGQRKAVQAAARFRSSLSIALALDAETGLEKI